MKTRNAIENGQTPNKYVRVCPVEAVNNAGDDAISVTIESALRGWEDRMEKNGGRIKASFAIGGFQLWHKRGASRVDLITGFPIGGMNPSSSLLVRIQ